MDNKDFRISNAFLNATVSILLALNYLYSPTDMVHFIEASVV
jgi:hypothetical protein